MPLALSALDLVPVPSGVSSGEAVRRSLALARELDRLGFRRVWGAGHPKTPPIFPTPPVTPIPLAAPPTPPLRGGSGGVILAKHAPPQVAEAFKMLECTP